MRFALKNLEETNRFGRELAEAASDGLLVALKGTLGAGKTALVKAVGAGLGVEEVISSPTFTMLNEYHSGRLPLYHLDLYRAHETGEKLDLSFLAMELDELDQEPNLMMIEWPQYFLLDGEDYFQSRDHLSIELEVAKRTGQVVAEDGLLHEAKDNNDRFIGSRNVLIKDGSENFESQRIATVKSLGERAELVRRLLEKNLDCFLINL